MEKKGIKKITEAAKKKKNSRFILFGIIFLVAIIVIAVAFNLIFSVKEITVENNTVYSDEELMVITGVKTGTPMLFINEKSAAKKVTDKLSYVDDVKIAKHWPFAVTVTFYPANPKYEIAVTEGGYIIVSDGLKVLEMTNDIDENLVFISGITIETYKVGEQLSEENNIEVGILSEIINAVQNEKFADAKIYSRISGMDFTKKYNYKIILDKTINVELGDSENIFNKIEELYDILIRNVDHKKMNISVRDYKSGRCTVFD